MLMQVNTCTFRFTSSKNAIKPPLSIVKELAEFLEVQIRDKGWIEAPPSPVNFGLCRYLSIHPNVDSPLHKQKQEKNPPKNNTLHNNL